MDVLTAQALFLALMTVCVCIWCHSFVRALRLGNKEAPESAQQEGESLAGFPPTADRDTGSRVVRGEREAVSRAIAKAVLQHGTAFEITERNADHVLVRRVPLTSHQVAGAMFNEMAFALRQVGDGTVEILYCVTYGKTRARLRKIALGIILGVGLPLTIGIGLVVWLFVVGNPMPGMRWQTLQVLHIGHALWPPFLLMHQYQSIRAQSRAFVSNLLMSVELTDGVEGLGATG